MFGLSHKVGGRIGKGRQPALDFVMGGKYTWRFMTTVGLAKSSGVRASFLFCGLGAYIDSLYRFLLSLSLHGLHSHEGWERQGGRLPLRIECREEAEEGEYTRIRRRSLISDVCILAFLDFPKPWSTRVLSCSCRCSPIPCHPWTLIACCHIVSTFMRECTQGPD